MLEVDGDLTAPGQRLAHLIRVRDLSQRSESEVQFKDPSQRSESEIRVRDPSQGSESEMRVKRSESEIRVKDPSQNPARASLARLRHTDGDLAHPPLWRGGPFPRIPSPV